MDFSSIFSPHNVGLKAVYLFGFILASFVRFIFTRHLKEERIIQKRVTDKSDIFFLAVTSVSLLVMPFIYLFSDLFVSYNYNLPEIYGKIGGIIFSFAIFILYASHADLKKGFSPFVEVTTNHKLVTNGIYAKIRHPMYLAHLLWGISNLFLIQNYIAGPALLISFLLFYHNRVQKEEALLLSVFGKEYEDYRAKTGRLMPPIFSK